MTYALGQVVPLTWTPGVSTTAVLTVTLPDGTTTAPAVTGTSPGPGPFTASYLPAQPGRYGYRWAGTNAASVPDVFEVAPAAAASLVGLADLRRHLGWPATKDASEDPDLLEMGAAATGIIEGELGRPLRRTTYALSWPAWGSSLVLPWVPCSCAVCWPLRVLTVTTVTRGGASVTDWSVDRYGILTRTGGGAWTVGTDVAWTAGYTITPTWAALAVKRLVEHLWGRARAARHSRTADSTGEGDPAAGFLLPYAVQSLLEPHAADGVA